MKIKAKRESIKFDYEFPDGTTVGFEYVEPTSEMIDEGLEIDDGDTKAKLDYVKRVFRECIRGDEELKEKMIDDLMRNGNIYETKAALDEALGKHKAKK